MRVFREDTGYRLVEGDEVALDALEGCDGSEELWAVVRLYTYISTETAIVVWLR